ncbi:hypothetical protein NC652_027950 [Populus alba x Populus x berolinensis]|nr:hypothetical protein NC652_027950 [Populus alba x Populus x berolinensis]
MNTRYSFPTDSFRSSSPAASLPSNSPIGEEHGAAFLRNRSPRLAPSSLFVRTAMRISRARWFTFLRRVFHYQNGSRSNLGSNPFNSSSWMMLEFVALLLQICITTFTLAISKAENPVWPVRIWIIGYNIGCVLSLLLLYGRYRQLNAAQGDGFGLPDLEQQGGNEESRYSHLMNKCRTSLELFFAIWFVMGNVWVFDSRFGSYFRAPKLHHCHWLQHEHGVRRERGVPTTKYPDYQAGGTKLWTAPPRSFETMLIVIQPLQVKIWNAAYAWPSIKT